MLICGLKLTHDGTIALVKDGKLICSVEMEKLDNNKRFKAVDDLASVSRVLADFGVQPGDVDRFIIDGWEGLENASVATSAAGRNVELPVALYREKNLSDDLLEPFSGSGLELAGKSFRYTSYTHVAGHVMGAYCASPFGQHGENALVLVWDGGMFPRLYEVNAATRGIVNHGPLFMLIGHTYAIFSQHFGPFYKNEAIVRDELSVAGKVMAYIALGQIRQELLERLDAVYTATFEPTMEFARKFSREFKQSIAGSGFSDEDVLASFHAFLENLLVEKLAKKMARLNVKGPRNLCFVGGCALNIKWNSAIRASGQFDSVWIPPFTNDTGSAIGTACCEMFHSGGPASLQWDVFTGPALGNAEPGAGWIKRECSLAELAKLMHTKNEAVVFLNGRAELGPRALGNRSIFAPALSPHMKDLLNKVKGREGYRPVAPICLESRAPEIFDPGCADPYMLFDHHVRPNWVQRVPAIMHLDGTARLQTVNESENPPVVQLLMEYERVSGIPLLCNTSANLNGCGFFPDAASAAKWNRLNYVWANGNLYEKEVKEKFF